MYLAKHLVNGASERIFFFILSTIIISVEWIKFIAQSFIDWWGALIFSKICPLKCRHDFVSIFGGNVSINLLEQCIRILLLEFLLSPTWIVSTPSNKRNVFLNCIALEIVKVSYQTNIYNYENDFRKILAFNCALC